VPRKKNNARRKFESRVSYSEMARKIGLTPRQKIRMLRYIRKQNKGR
jgi:hypothetical protein